MHDPNSEKTIQQILERIATANDLVTDLVNLHCNEPGSWPEHGELTEEQRCALTLGAEAHHWLANVRALLRTLLDQEWAARNEAEQDANAEAAE